MALGTGGRKALYHILDSSGGKSERTKKGRSRSSALWRDRENYCTTPPIAAGAPGAAGSAVVGSVKMPMSGNW